MTRLDSFQLHSLVATKACLLKILRCNCPIVLLLLRLLSCFILILELDLRLLVDELLCVHAEEVDEKMVLWLFEFAWIHVQEDFIVLRVRGSIVPLCLLVDRVKA